MQRRGRFPVMKPEQEPCGLSDSLRSGGKMSDFSPTVNDALKMSGGADSVRIDRSSTQKYSLFYRAVPLAQ